MGRLMLLVVAGALVACSPPCGPYESKPDDVCLPQATPDGGQPFVLRATAFFGNDAVTPQSCVATVEGQVISITLKGNVCPGSAFAQMSPVARPGSSDCGIAALPAGKYSVSGVTASTFTVPASSDDTIRRCP